MIDKNKKLLLPFFVLLLILMGYLGSKAYVHALAYEAYTTELVNHQGIKAQATRKLSKLTKKLLGKYYTDEKTEGVEALKAKKVTAGEEAKNYTYYFMVVLLLLLIGTYFVLSLQFFTVLGTVGAMLSLLFGLISPILMVTIHKEVEYVGDIILSFESKGIIGSITKLWESGDVIVALVILLFSVLMPILKTGSLLFISLFIESRATRHLVNFFKLIGKWSMVDVFVVAIFLVYLTANKGDVSRAEIEIGLYFFLAYVIVSMLLSLSAEKMLKQIKA